jgi:hypothetical protein
MLIFIFCGSLQAMERPSSPRSDRSSSSTRELTPTELATAVSFRLFNHKDDEVISVFAKILTKDKKGDLKLHELRYRMVRVLEESVCGEKA